MLWIVLMDKTVSEDHILFYMNSVFGMDSNFSVTGARRSHTVENNKCFGTTTKDVPENL